LIVPADALPPVTPFTCQLTEVFDEPLTAALKLWVAPIRTLALAGDTETVMPDDAEFEVDPPEFDAPLVEPVHPDRAAAVTMTKMRMKCRNSIFLNRSDRNDTSR
jgi:hypothetical protein